MGLKQSLSPQLKELWIKSVTDATNTKIKEECTPGKPITVFSAQPHEVCSLCVRQ